MARDLVSLVDPARTVVVTMECQRAVIGDLSPFAALRDAAVEAGVLANLRYADLSGADPRRSATRRFNQASPNMTTAVTAR